jgi:hypothetical protein
VVAIFHPQAHPIKRFRGMGRDLLALVYAGPRLVERLNLKKSRDAGGYNRTMREASPDALRQRDDVPGCSGRNGSVHRTASRRHRINKLVAKPRSQRLSERDPSTKRVEKAGRDLVMLLGCSDKSEDARAVSPI